MNVSLQKSVFKFFFRQRKEDLFFLPFFRMTIGGFAFIHLLFMREDFFFLYGSRGLVEGSIMSSFKPYLIPNIPQISTILTNSFHINENAALTFFFSAYLLAALCLFAGLCSRAAAIFLLILHLITFRGSPLYSYGADNISTIMLFYCCFFPLSGQFSLDNKIFKRNKSTANPSFYRKVLQVHLCIIYFSSGFEKLMGIDWRNGEAIWQSLHLLKFDLILNLQYEFLAAFPVIAAVLSWGVILLEMGYPFFVFNKRCRTIGLVLISMLHIGIAIFIGLYYFSVLMTLLSCLALLNFDSKYALYIINAFSPTDTPSDNQRFLATEKAV